MIPARVEPQIPSKIKKPKSAIGLGERPRFRATSLEPSPFQNADAFKFREGRLKRFRSNPRRLRNRRGLVLRALGFLSVRLRESEKQGDSTPLTRWVQTIEPENGARHAPRIGCDKVAHRCASSFWGRAAPARCWT